MTATAAPVADPVAPQPDPERSSRRLPRAVVDTAVVLLVLDLATAAQASWVGGLVAVAVLLTLPGHLLLRAAGLRAGDMARSPAWLPAASLLVLMGVGLAVDLVGPLLGLEQPLRTVPLLIALNVFCLAAAAVPRPGAPLEDLGLALSRWDRFGCWWLLLPAVAAAGAERLDNGRGSVAALLATAAAAAAVAVGAWRAPYWSPQRQGWLLYSTSLALLLQFSLRSDYLFGWDITNEYAQATQTITDGLWPTAHPGDAYGAMLSLTVLPAVLHQLTGFSVLVLLKLLYPVLFALVPVAALYLIRGVLGPRSAFVGAALLLAQQSFVQEMPALARQEIALVFFVALLAVLVDRSPTWWSRLWLPLAFTLGATVSHYSTTYTLLTVLAGGVLLRVVVGRLHRAPSFDVRSLVALAAAAVFALVWYQQVTQSTSHTIDTANQLLQSGLKILPTGDGENALQVYLRGPKPAAAVSVAQYQVDVVAEYRASRPWLVPTAGASDARWALVPAPAAPETPPSPLRALLVLGTLLVSQVVVLLSVVGTAGLLLGRRIRGPLLDVAVLAGPAVVLLGLSRVSSALSDFYGQTRLYIQLLPIVAVPVLWAGRRLILWADLAWHRAVPDRRPVSSVFRSSAVAVGVLATAALVAVATGLTAAMTGDRSPANLFNGSEHYDRFYTFPEEVAAAKWLASVEPEGSLTFTDLYGALRIVAYGKPKGDILTDITPGTLDEHAWVYATRVNIVDEQARGYADGQTVVYGFPRPFLLDQFGVSYTNGTSEVYHR